MNDQRGIVRQIAWREVFPWLIILRAFRLAIAPTALLVATLAVFVSSLGWVISPYVFLTQQQRQERFHGELAAAPADAIPPDVPLARKVPQAISKYFPNEPSGLVEPFFALSDPASRLFSYRVTINEAAYYLFGLLWTLAVWAFAGGFITRRAVVQVGVEDTPGLVETAQFVGRRWPWYFLAPLYPLLGILILLLLHVPLGGLMRIDFFVAVAGVLWLFVVLASVAAAWLLLGTLLSWPLMWGALSAEREGDAFEAFSRSFSYVYGKPLHYLFYAVVAAILGALGYAVVQVFVHVVHEFGFWAVSWGAGRDRVDEIRLIMNAGDADQPLGFGIWMLSFWRHVVYAFLQGYTFAYFWSAAGIIYLLLRYDVDEKEMDEIYLPQDEPAPGPSPAPASLPPAPMGPSTLIVPPPADSSAEETSA